MTKHVIPEGVKVEHVEVVKSDQLIPVPVKSLDLRPYERPDELYGVTYKIKPPTMESAVYVTINDIEMDIEGERIVRPLEIFIASKDVSHLDWSTALCRLLSGHFRSKSDFRWVIEELREVRDQNGGYFIPGSGGVRVGSVVAHIGYLLHKHCAELHLLDAPQADLSEEVKQVLAEKQEKAEKEGKKGSPCPKCQESKVFLTEGCLTCVNCGYSKCEGE